MATAIALVGKSSTGKSTSLRNLVPTESVVISPTKAELPIPKFKDNYKLASIKGGKIIGNFIMTSDLLKVGAIIDVLNKDEKVKVIVVEDTTHYFNKLTLSDDFRAKGKTKDGTWSRWADLAADIYKVLFSKLDTLREDLTIVFQFHSEVISDGISEVHKIKTPGSMLEREVDIPSYFSYVLYTKVLPLDKDIKAGDRYKFLTNEDGIMPAKTPYGMFTEEELLIENDLKAVIDRIKTY